MTRELTPSQIGQLDAREFLGDDVWKAWKSDYDLAMSYRKTLKGKPTDEQRIQLQINSELIKFYSTVLFHSAQLAKHDRCVCASCSQKRQNKQS